MDNVCVYPTMIKLKLLNTTKELVLITKQLGYKVPLMIQQQGGQVILTHWRWSCTRPSPEPRGLRQWRWVARVPSLLLLVGPGILCRHVAAIMLSILASAPPQRSLYFGRRGTFRESASCKHGVTEDMICTVKRSSYLFRVWNESVTSTFNIFTNQRNVCNLSEKDTRIKNAGFWDVTPCGFCKNRRFEGNINMSSQRASVAS
jgi:hypothetical protein